LGSQPRRSNIVKARFADIPRGMGGWWVDGYESLIPVMTNEEKDRHVLAAAVRARSEVIVTYNIKDFPRASLAPYSISVQGPSTFLKNLYELDPVRVMQTLLRQAAAIDQTLPFLLSKLRANVPGFVTMLEKARMPPGTRSIQQGSGKARAPITKIVTMYKASTGDCGVCSLKSRCTQAPRRGLARHLMRKPVKVCPFHEGSIRNSSASSMSSRKAKIFRSLSAVSHHKNYGLTFHRYIGSSARCSRPEPDSAPENC
jgi:hypothetical protein